MFSINCFTASVSQKMLAMRPHVRGITGQLKVVSVCKRKVRDIHARVIARLIAIENSRWGSRKRGYQENEITAYNDSR
jgi:hypothetical protein